MALHIFCGDDISQIAVPYDGHELLCNKRQKLETKIENQIFVLQGKCWESCEKNSSSPLSYMRAAGFDMRIECESVLRSSV